MPTDKNVKKKKKNKNLSGGERGEKKLQVVGDER